jgi:hypothetical protein
LVDGWSLLIVTISTPDAVFAVVRKKASHLRTAVDRDHAVGDVGGVVLEQESDGVGDLCGRPSRRMGMLANVPVEGLFGDGCHHLGVDEAGGDAVHDDALADCFQGQALGEPDQAGFGGGVVGLADAAGLTDDRADGFQGKVVRGFSS